MNTVAEAKSDLLRVFGTQVKDRRRSVGMTQDDLAEKCGIYRTYLSRIEGGIANPSLLVLAAIANALQVEPWELIRDRAKPVNLEETLNP